MYVPLGATLCNPYFFKLLFNGNEFVIMKLILGFNSYPLVPNIYFRSSLNPNLFICFGSSILTVTPGN